MLLPCLFIPSPLWRPRRISSREGGGRKGGRLSQNSIWISNEKHLPSTDGQLPEDFIRTEEQLQLSTVTHYLVIILYDSAIMTFDLAIVTKNLAISVGDLVISTCHLAIMSYDLPVNASDSVIISYDSAIISSVWTNIVYDSAIIINGFVIITSDLAIMT